jgi:membrane protein DedA with SNARE-associated domain
MYESIANHLVNWLLAAPILVCFAGSFFGGTAVTLLLATFGGSAAIPWWPILAGAFLGNFVSDIGWFALARSRLSDGLRRSRFFKDQSAQIRGIRDNYRKRDWLFFVAIKFAYGLRIAQILILGAAHYAWRRFLHLDGVAVLVINCAAVMAGWMFGRGVTRYLNLFENAGMSISILALLIMAFLAVRWLINRYMLRKR